jgi:hypothetical protein
MLDKRHRLLGRFFYFAVVIAGLGIGLSAFGADSQSGAGVATTMVSDTVYLADGSRRLRGL